MEFVSAAAAYSGSEKMYLALGRVGTNRPSELRIPTAVIHVQVGTEHVIDLRWIDTGRFQISR